MAQHARELSSIAEPAEAEKALPRLYAEQHELQRLHIDLRSRVDAHEQRWRSAGIGVLTVAIVVVLIFTFTSPDALYALAGVMLLGTAFAATQWIPARLESAAVLRQQLAKVETEIPSVAARILAMQRRISATSPPQTAAAMQDPVPTKDSSDRRRTPRCRETVTLTVVCEDGDDFAVTGRTIDVSTYGASIMIDRFVRLTSVVELSADTRPATVRATVRSNRTDQPTGAPVIGVEYLGGARHPFGYGSAP